MLEVFCEKFHRWEYIKFSELDQNKRQVFKEIFMAKKIYMGRPSDHVNQRLVNFVIDKQFLTWNKNNLHNYKTMYLTSKAWPLLKLRESLIPQQLTPFVKEKINPIDNEKQQTMTLGPA